MSLVWLSAGEQRRRKMKYQNLKRLWVIILVITVLLVAVILSLGYQSFKIIEKAGLNDLNQPQLFLVGLSILIILFGSVYGWVLFYRTRKFLEKEIENKIEGLREAEDRYRRLVELSPHGIGIQSEDKIVFMNSVGAKLFGAENPAQLLGKSVWDFVLPKHQAMLKERYRPMKEQKKKVSLIEQRFIRLDGTSVDAEMIVTPFTFQGKPAFQAIFHDITERKRAEEALKAAYTFQQAILDGVAHPIMVIGADYRVKLMNRAACEFSGGDFGVSNPIFCYQVSHQRETPCNGLEHPCPMEQVRQSGQAVTVVHQHYQTNGQLRYVEIIASPLWGPDGAFQGIIESIRDITERTADKPDQPAQGVTPSEDDLEQFAHKVVKSFQDFFSKLPPDQMN